MNTPDTREAMRQPQQYTKEEEAKRNADMQPMNTPDTEWSEAFDKEWLETGCNSYGVATKGVVKDMFARLVFSRDTYWKERVWKEVEGLQERFGDWDNGDENEPLLLKCEVLGILDNLK